MVTAAMKSEDICFLAGKLPNLDRVFKSRDITWLTKVRGVKAMIFPEDTYGYESRNLKKAEH